MTQKEAKQTRKRISNRGNRVQKLWQEEEPCVLQELTGGSASLNRVSEDEGGVRPESDAWHEHHHYYGSFCLENLTEYGMAKWGNVWEHHDWYSIGVGRSREYCLTFASPAC